MMEASSGQATPSGIPLADRVLALTTRNPRAALELALRGLAGSSRREERARLLRAAAHAERAIGRYARARQLYLRARHTFSRLGLEREHAICALGLVDACMYLGRIDEGLRAADKARRVFLRHRDRIRLARLETNVGNLHHRVDALEPALTHYDRAARLFAHAGSPVDRARLDHNRANVLTHLGRRREAETLYRRTRDVLTSAAETIQAAQASYGLACLRFLNGEYAAAIAELEDVRPELARLGARPLLALADLDLAEVLLAMRLYPETLVLARAAGRWFRDHGVAADAARCELIMAQAQIGLGRLDEAEHLVRRTDRFFHRQRLDAARAASCVARGRIEWQRGRPAAAARKALRAMTIFRRAGFPVRALAAGGLAAEAFLEASRPQEALRIARALRLERRHPGDAYSRSRIARAGGAAAARLGQMRASLASYREALRESRRAQAALVVDEWRLGFIEEEPSILDEYLGLLLKRRPRPQPREIWAWLARARALLEPTRSVPGRPKAVGDQVERLRAELEACYARLWRIQSGARRAESSATRTLETRALRLEGRLRRLAAPTLEPRPASFLEPPKSHGRTTIIYFSAAGRLSALRHDDQGWSLHPDLLALREAERLLNLFHYQMEARGSDHATLVAHRVTILARAAEHLGELGRRLLNPVLGSSPTLSRLHVVPHGPLVRLPFHALPWQGAALVERADLSVGGLDEIPAAAKGRRGAWVISHAGSGPVGIEEEGRRVTARLTEGGAPVEFRGGASATVASMREAAQSAAVIHLAGHAIYRAQHPEFSALRLADGWLNAADLAALPLRGACVVLSACETGPRGVVGGGEVLGLIRGLLRAGSSAVVASLWRIDDRATADFMDDLYRDWQALGRLGPALARVQRARSASNDPYLWAPFSLTGDPDAAWPGQLPRPS